MIIIKLKDKYLIEIDKLNVILQDKEINNTILLKVL
jgi:hypothetical protein